LKGVEIDGTTITKATLHNFDMVDKLDIRMGDTVLVEKAGKIIPHILSVDKTKRKGKPRKFARPTKCPMCQGAVVKDGVAIKCANTLGCKAQLEATILSAADRSRLDIDGLGPVLIQNLIDKGLVKCFLDMWRLKDKRKEMLTIEGIGEKTIDKLLAELEKAKKVSPDKWLSCLNIPGLGRTKSKALINTYGGYQFIPDDPEKLATVLGKVGAAKFIKWQNTRENSQLIVDILNLGFDHGKKVTKAAKAVEGPLTGKKVCATGTFSGFTRETIHDAIVRAGGVVASSVSSKTAYLIVGKDAGSKATNAEKLKVPCLTEDQFVALVSK
jgi:DNA ligase (NAD+)